MTHSQPTDAAPDERDAAGVKRQPRRVTLPGFISEDIGLGDVIKHVTNTFGIRTCGGCQRRADFLNSRIVFSPRKR